MILRCGGTRRARQAGLTVLELLVVLAIIGLLTGIAIPAVRYALLRARVQAIGADLKLIELAVHQLNADKGTLPPETATGAQPAALAPYLPRKLAWDNLRRGYRLDWENWVLATGKPRFPSTGVMLGVSVVTTDKELAAIVLKLGPPPMVPTTANKYTYVIRPVK